MKAYYSKKYQIGFTKEYSTKNCKNFVSVNLQSFAFQFLLYTVSKTTVGIIWAGSKHGKRLQDIVSLLIGIDSHASCYGDVLTFIQQVSEEKGKYEDREWDLLLNRGENPHAVIQLEIEAARAIAESHTPEGTMRTRRRSFN